MDKIYSGVIDPPPPPPPLPRLALVKHAHKRGATNPLIRPSLPDLPSNLSPGQSEVLALRGHRPTVTSITRIPSSNDNGRGTRSTCRVSNRPQRKREVTKRRLICSSFFFHHRWDFGLLSMHWPGVLLPVFHLRCPSWSLLTYWSTHKDSGGGGGGGWVYKGASYLPDSSFIGFWGISRK